MQGKDEIEAQNRLRLFTEALHVIGKQIKEKFKNNGELLKLLDDLNENKEFIEGILDTSKDNEKISGLAKVGRETLEELQQKINAQNRNIAALLKGEFNKINEYYLPFFPQKNPAVLSSNVPSQLMNGFTAGRDIKNVSQIYNVHELHPQAEKLLELWNVPPRNKFFTGRDELLKQITEYFNAKESKHLVLTAHGLGGIGKTQLILEYIWQHYKKYNGVCWFNAESRERLMADYISLGQELNLVGMDKNISLEEKAKLVKTYLEEPQRAGWLLIYDSALKQDDINNLIPVKEGKILISSRHIHWPQYQTIAVGLFSLKEAQNYMKKIIIENKYNETEANLLIQKLGNLPLALAQACAYIEQNNISIAEYLDLYQKKHEMLLVENLLPQDEYQKAVAVTWNITLDQMKKEAPESVQLLYCCSHLYHEQIPEILVPHFFEGADETEKKLIANKVKRIAKQYSMITIDEQKQTFSMHSLVQQVIRDQLIKEKKGVDYLLKGIKALNKAYPLEIGKMITYNRKKLFLPHLQSTQRYLDKFLENQTSKEMQDLEKLLYNDLLQMLYCLANAYRDVGMTTDSIKTQKIIHKFIEMDFGPNHPTFAMSLNDLVDAYGELGDLKEKKELAERALVIMEVYYKYNDHHNMVPILQTLGKLYIIDAPSKSIELLNRALNIIKRHVSLDTTVEVLDHIQMMLGIAYYNLGIYENSKVLLQNVLNSQKSYYENDHVIIAKTLINLGNVYGKLGDDHEKKNLLEQALKINKNHYGKSHYEVATVLTNLGDTYRKLGLLREAETLLTDALKINIAYYGEKHVEVARTLVNISNIYIKYSQYIDTAISFLKEALKIFENNYGNEHADVATVQSNLGYIHYILGNMDTAEIKLRSALEIYEKVYDKFNIEIARVLKLLANVYSALEKFEYEKTFLERSLKIQEAYYGKEHIEVAKALSRLGMCYIQQKNLVEAKKFIQRAYDIFINSPNCGKNHPYTQEAKQELDEINQKLLNFSTNSKNLFREASETTGEYSPLFLPKVKLGH